VRFLPDILTRDVWGFWEEREASGYYRPLMHILYMAVYSVAGLSYWAYHLLNVIFHAATQLTVLLLVRELRSSTERASPWLVPFLAALLFATHPIHSAAVAWVGGIPDLSFSFLALLSLWLFLRSTSEQNTSPLPFAASLSAFALSLLAKEPAVTLPVILLAYDYSRGGRRLQRNLAKHLAYLLMAGAYLAVRFSVLGGAALGKRDGSLESWLPQAFALFGRYLGKLLLPIQLNAYHPASSVGSLADASALAGLGLLLAVGVALYSSARRSTFVFSSLVIMVVPLLPALYIPAIGGTPFAERYLYLPSVGFVSLLALVIERASARLRDGTPAALVIGVCIAVLYAGGTLTRNPVWEDDYRLWSVTVRKSPQSGVPRNNLGRAYFNRGDVERAIEEYEAALRLNPRHAEAHNNLGAALATRNRFEEAEAEFLTALELEPGYSDAHNNLGILYGSRGNPELAIAHFQDALRVRPDFPDAHHNLGVTYLNQGRLDLAIEHLQSALERAPDAVNTHVNLARAYELKGELDAAHRRRLRAQGLAGGRRDR